LHGDPPIGFCLLLRQISDNASSNQTVKRSAIPNFEPVMQHGAAIRLAAMSAFTAVRMNGDKLCAMSSGDYFAFMNLRPCEPAITNTKKVFVHSNPPIGFVAGLTYQPAGYEPDAPSGGG
jgi:hypothetical protein